MPLVPDAPADVVAWYTQFKAGAHRDPTDADIPVVEDMINQSLIDPDVYVRASFLDLNGNGVLDAQDAAALRNVVSYLQPSNIVPIAVLAGIVGIALLMKRRR